MTTADQNPPPARVKDLPASQRRVIRAWCMYDWANSAFATSGTAAILPIYFVYLFEEAMGDANAGVFLGIAFTGSSVWSLGVAISTAFVALTSPILGVIADRAPIKKTLLWVYTIIGSLFHVSIVPVRLHWRALAVALRNVHARQRRIRRRLGVLQRLPCRTSRPTICWTT